MWEIAIDNWTRNWNLYGERLTDSILEKFGMNNKRQKRQTKISMAPQQDHKTFSLNTTIVTEKK